MENLLYRKKKYYHISNVMMLFLIAVLFIAVYTCILQGNYRQNTLEEAVERDIACSDAIHQVVSNKFTREDYSQINTVRADRNRVFILTDCKRGQIAED